MQILLKVPKQEPFVYFGGSIEKPEIIKAIDKRGIPYECLRDYIHVLLNVGGIKIDLWATTGRWKSRELKTKQAGGVGVESLMKKILILKRRQNAKLRLVNT